MMLALVSRSPTLNKRIESQSCKHDSGDYQTWNQNIPRNCVTKEICLKRWRHTNKAIKPTHIPIGLRTSRNLRGRVGTIEPDWVDRSYRSKECRNTEDDKEEAACFSHIDRHEWISNNILLSATRTRELCVLLVPDEHEVHCDECKKNSRKQENVNYIDSRNKCFTREGSTECKE